jgi:hypothetical protein
MNFAIRSAKLSGIGAFRLYNSGLALWILFNFFPVG